MKRQLAFYYDQNYCIGCQACEVACKTKNNLDVGVRWRVVDDFEVVLNKRQVDRYLSRACMHCEKPVCVTVCPAKAYTKRAQDGIVVQDHSKCIGCGACVKACPYRAPVLNRRDNKASKCDLCADYVGRGEDPACVRGCPVQVLKLGDITTLDKNGTAKICLGFTLAATEPSMRFKATKQ